MQQPRLRITVPASSANLGPGFDVLGLALDLHNTFTVTPAGATTITIEGAAADLPLDESNLFYNSFRHLYSLHSLNAPAVDIHMRLDVPPGRGLGSSATAVVGGLLAANALMGSPFSPARLLAEAVKLEQGQHADNVAPALLGGLVVNVVREGEVISLPVPFPADLKAVLYIPDFKMDTVQGRALMPVNYSKEDVVFSTGRVALFIAAVTSGRYDLLATAMQDRLHQPYREQIFPPLPLLIYAAISAGAHGACLSGGGSSILALASDRSKDIALAVHRAGKAAGLTGQARVLDISPRGASVTWLETGESVP